jgi:putative ABC transport system substrate-binding protein
MVARREVLGGALGLLAAPRAARAQAPGKLSRVGFLAPASESAARQLLDSFRRGLRDAGFTEGEALHFVYRWSENRDERFPALAAELVSQKVDVIVAVTVPAIRAVQQATSTIPVVMVLSSDPVRMGLVASLAHPGGNTTGMASLNQEVAVKRLEILKEIVPPLGRVAVLWNPVNPAMQTEWEHLSAAARVLRVTLRSQEVRTPGDLDPAFSIIASERPDGLVVVGDPLTFILRARIVEFAAAHRLPAVYGTREFAQVGGLVSYGNDLADLFQRAGGYVARLLRGARPADLPVEQPAKFELVVNLRTARTLALSLPPSILARADEVVE